MSQHYKGKLTADGNILKDNTFSEIAFCESGVIIGDDDKANARELAKRWNSHAELVELVREMIAREKFMAEVFPPDPLEDKYGFNWLKKAKQLLTRLKEPYAKG